MRLIDVSELKEWVENWFVKNRFYHPYAKSNNIPTTELYDILEQMPTIEDVQPVVHGEWIDGNKRQTCSICRYRGVRSWAYCPSCGAKMETSNE